MRGRKKKEKSLLALFGDVKALRAIWIVIATAKEFTKNRVVAAGCASV